MAWESKTVAEICQQIKDPARKGNRPVAALIAHIGKDKLVGWAWSLGFGRTPAPGTQAQAGDLVKAWAESGAACPQNDRHPVAMGNTDRQESAVRGSSSTREASELKDSIARLPTQTLDRRTIDRANSVEEPQEF